MAKNNKFINTRTIMLIIVAVLTIILFALVLYYIKISSEGEKKPQETSSSIGTVESPTAKPSETKPSVTETPAQNPTENVTEEQTQAPTDAPTAAPTEPPTDPPTQAPTQPVVKPENGTWDLSVLPTKMIPFGNNRDDVNAVGIPNGIFYYRNLYGKYNVDFISDLAIAYSNKETTEKSIYLTMDCGFDNEHTGPILDILKAKNVKATFFVTSMFYDARPDLIRRMIEEGHRIGSHSIHHYDMTTLSVEQQKTEILDVVNKLKRDFDYDCYLFRFPEGSFSEESLALVENLGMKSVFWSYAYNDFSAVQPEVAPSLESAVKYLHPGAIYLLHASSSTNRAFLGDWIDAARSKGYEFAGVYPLD